MLFAATVAAKVADNFILGSDVFILVMFENYLFWGGPIWFVDFTRMRNGCCACAYYKKPFTRRESV